MSEKLSKSEEAMMEMIAAYTRETRDTTKSITGYDGDSIQKDAVIRARISQELKKQFDKLCREKGMSSSEYLRFMILAEIEKNKK